MTTKVLKCKCNHAWQDKEYGAGMRVHNQVETPKEQPKKYRCTVCSEVRGE